MLSMADLISTNNIFVHILCGFTTTENAYLRSAGAHISNIIDEANFKEIYHRSMAIFRNVDLVKFLNVI